MNALIFVTYYINCRIMWRSDLVDVMRLQFLELFYVHYFGSKLRILRSVIATSTENVRKGRQCV